MSDLQAFFAQNVKSDITEEFIVSDRFRDGKNNPIPWRIRTMTESENEEIRKSVTKMVKGKGGAKTLETNPEEYVARLVTASIVFPNLKDAELQKSYGILGAESLLKKMLLSGEYAALVQKVQELNGFDKDINETIEDIKN